jgi:DNA repair ATPase RecN
MSGTEPTRFTGAQRAGLDARQLDQDRTLEAVHGLEAALASAAPGREAEWRDEVLATLAALDDVTSEEQANAQRADSLLSDIARTQPRLGHRVRGVRAQYRQLRDAISALRRELEPAGEDPPDIADVRQRVAWMLSALRHQRARESDLIYEAYYEAFQTDVGEGDRTPRRPPG